MDRERLYQVLDGLAARPVFSVVAPPLWGKSLLVAGWAASRGLRETTRWCRPGQPLPTGADGIERLVLDDLHLSADGELDERLRAAAALDVPLVLLARRPLGVRLRDDLGLPAPVLGREDLAFDLAEVRDLLAKAGRAPSLSQAQRLLDVSTGWPAAVAATATERPADGRPGWPGPRLTTAVEEEVLAGLSDAEVDLALRLSVVDVVPTPLLRRLAPGGPHAAPDPALIGLLASGVLARTEGGLALAAGLAGCLPAMLSRKSPSLAAALHAEVARWYDAHDDLTRAVEHARLAGDVALLEGLLRRAWLDLAFTRPVLLRDALTLLPARGRTDPEFRLAAVAAWSHVDPEGSAVLLRGVLSAAATGLGVPCQQARLRAVLLTHVVTCLVAARGGGVELPPLDAAVEPLRSVEGLADDVAPALAEAVVAALLVQGSVHLLLGRLGEAAGLLHRGISHAAMAGMGWPVAIGQAHLALCRVLSGEPGRAEECLDQAPDVAAGSAAAAGLVLARALVLLEQGEAQAAGEHLAHVRRAALEPALWPLLLHAEGLTDLQTGDHETGLERLLGDSSRTAATPFLSDLVFGTRDLLAARTGAGVPAGAPAGVAGWGRLAAASAELMGGEVASARSLADTGEGGGDGDLRVRIDLLLVAAAATLELGDRSGALGQVERALGRAALTGAWRPFQQAPRSVLARLLTLVEQHSSSPTSRDRAADVRARLALPDIASLELPALSPRELLVLARLGSGRPTHVIAQELYVSPNTLKTQVRSIYRKLQVTSREEAVERGRQLGLLP